MATTFLNFQITYSVGYVSMQAKSKYDKGLYTDVEEREEEREKRNML